MSVRAQDIVVEALSWVNTPWEHQGRIKGVGVDCGNFLSEVCAATGATTDVKFEREYRRHEDGQTIRALLERYSEYVGDGDFLDDARPGDVIALHDGKKKDGVRHLAFFTGFARYPKMIHASKHGVHHHRIDGHFRSLIHSVWRIPGLIYE